MPEPLPLPVRVLVKGASTVVYTSYMGGPRTDFAFSRVIEEELLAAGRPAEVDCKAIPAERLKTALKTWPAEVLTWSPDVIILHYGHMETVHLFLPRRLERHAHSLARRPGRIRELYRKRVLKPLWKALSSGQRVIDAQLPPDFLSYKPKQAAADLERIIERMRSVGSPLILIPDNVKPGPSYRHFFPGMEQRIRTMNATIAAMVERLDEPDVRVFKVTEIVDRMYGPDGEPAPDGGHYTPELHRAVGEGLADVILEWVAAQPHLNRHVGERPAATG